MVLEAERVFLFLLYKQINAIRSIQSNRYSWINAIIERMAEILQKVEQVQP